MLSPIFKKKWGISPRWTIRRAGEPALFSGIRREGSLGARDLPRIVLFRGGGLGGYTRPLPQLVHLYFFMEASTTPKTHILLTRLPFWG